MFAIIEYLYTFVKYINYLYKYILIILKSKLN